MINENIGKIETATSVTNAGYIAGIAEFSPFGNDLFGEPIKQLGRGKVSDNFTCPPFSVLNARDGWWQERKKAWLSLGIDGECGREENLLGSRLGYEVMEKNDNSKRKQQGTSIFDPVLCELAYKWFCPFGGQVLDPFAGGSVRGIVAALLGYKYWGVDLRQEQICANKQQAEKICDDIKPVWVCGDALDKVGKNAPEADFIFSCPPYGDLEKYSDDPKDLSNMEYHTFVANLKRIVMRACLRLKNDSFACFVVGDFRDKKGFYRGFVVDTINAFREQDLKLYNDAVLVTSVGSLPIRINRQFSAGRKLGKTHQNVLIFVKGDGLKAADRIRAKAI